MNARQLQLQGIGDPRLAVHAASALAAWLWSTDGAQVLWANPVGASLFGASNMAELARKTFGPADARRRQVVQLAGQLSPTGAIRLERLRGFGASPGMLMTCSCARLDFPDGSHGILIAATEASQRIMPLSERLRLLVQGFEAPIAAFARDGMFIAASEAARPLFGFRDLAGADFDEARNEALRHGRAEMRIGIGRIVLQRVGSGNEVGIVALIAPDGPHGTEPPKEDAAAPPARSEPVQSTHPDAPAETPVNISTSSEALPPMAPSANEPVSRSAAAPSSHDEAAITPPRHPLRFTWQMDVESRFALGSDEFTRLIGTRTAAGFGRPWQEIADSFGIDSAGRVVEAIATRDTWSGITVYWPVDGGGRVPVELSGFPIYDHERSFAGYRGFGVCRDLDSLAHLADLRDLELFGDPAATTPAPAADIFPIDAQQEDAELLPATLADMAVTPSQRHGPIADETSPQADPGEPVEAPANVVLFRPAGDTKSPVLTPVENSAFDELARQLAARLLRNTAGAPESAVTSETAEMMAEPSIPQEEAAEHSAPRQVEWLQPSGPPARGASRRDRKLLDLLPTGVMIYRLDRLLYANPAFLERLGYDSLNALEQAGGLDALYVEAGVSSASSTSEAGTPVTISAGQDGSGPSTPTAARLFTISWDGEPAHALMFAPLPEAASASAATPTRVPMPAPAPEPVAAGPLQAAGYASAEDLGAILDTTAEGIVMFDAEGDIHACNRSAEALFGYDGDTLVRRNLADLFAPESQRAVAEYLDSVKNADVASLLDHGRDVLGRVSMGGIIPLSMTMGRTRPGGRNFFAVFRDLSQGKKGESELQQARRLVDRAANAKADMVARISHEVRAPLSAIIGFAEVMIAERFGSLGNPRYVEYLKDIRASSERVTGILDDLAELARIETGKLDLAFANQNLNELVESCVTVMQPQANRERIIIRTSLAQALPPVVADGRALRQITLNLIGNSIHLANPAGQVIVSTALSDFGEVVLRVRDTGHGLDDNVVAAAMEPFRTRPPSDETFNTSPVSLSLTKALVEANRAKFQIKNDRRSGTLIEVVFPRAVARA